MSDLVQRLRTHWDGQRKAGEDTCCVTLGDEAADEIERLQQAGVGYSQQTVDAITKEREALRAEVATRDAMMSDQASTNAALRAEVERLRSNRGLPMGMIAITIHEWDRVKLGHDRYEAVRRASLRQMHEIWEAALRGDTRFDEAVDRLRDADPTSDSHHE